MRISSSNLFPWRQRLKLATALYNDKDNVSAQRQINTTIVKIKLA